MDLALYYPELGYYSSEKIKLGKKGDYYTSPLVHRIFGELLCKQMAGMWEISAKGDFTIVEMGAGDGTLCCDILNHARKEYPAFYDSIHYIIIEESRGMRKVQREKLRGNHITPPLENGVENGGEGGFEAESAENKILWLDYSDPLFNSGINGCFISNELVDAFPVHLVEMTGGELKEVYVGIQSGTFTELLDVPSTPEINKYFERLGIYLEEGQRVEVNLRATDWMKWVAGSLNKGFVITVDYGYPAEELYSSFRKKGTLLCYSKHRIIEDPYVNIGEQDITSHIDFTTLVNTGEGEALHLAGLTDQTHFLFGLGLGQVIQSSALNSPDDTYALEQRLMIKNLIMPGGMGSIFKVLIQYKGFAEIPELAGLKKDLSIF
ncbi:MAG: SAM-dependent methyltransferase [Nitrospira sp.]|nr:SAM-dependent methyltransferase [Nitrospira sp.]